MKDFPSGTQGNWELAPSGGPAPRATTSDAPGYEMGRWSRGGGPGWRLPTERNRPLSDNGARDGLHTGAARRAGITISGYGRCRHRAACMAIHEASKKWTMPIRHWKQALNHFAILYEGRMPEPTSN